MKPLVSLEQALALDPATARAWFGEYVNPGLLAIYGVLGTADLDVAEARGTELVLRDGRVVLDFSTGMGVAGFGHNHPRIVAAERRCHDAHVLDVIKVAPHRLQAVLAKNLATLLPAPLSVSFFATSGAEAVEGAMKLCERARPGRTTFVTTSGAYHGKTHGTLPLTTSGGFDAGYLRGLPAEQVIVVPYGDTAALRDVLARHGDRVVAVIAEPVQGQGVVEAPSGYLADVVRLAHQHGALAIFDEVKVGIGRTGTFCAFERDGAVPDVVTLSKALGGGKRAISAFVTSPALFAQAYPRRSDAGLHTTTFGGLGETCAVAIEALCLLHDEDLLGNVRRRGDALRDALLALQRKHPNAIAEVRGRGLFLGVRFQWASARLQALGFDPARLGPLGTGDAALMTALVRSLYRDHGILAHFAASDPDVLHLMPPMNVSEAHCARVVDALDRVLTRGIAAAAADLAAGLVTG